MSGLEDLDGTLEATQQDLAALRNQLIAMESRYRDYFPGAMAGEAIAEDSVREAAEDTETVQKLQTSNKALEAKVEKLTEDLKTAGQAKQQLEAANRKLREQVDELSTQRAAERAGVRNRVETARGRLSSRGQRQNVAESSPDVKSKSKSNGVTPKAPVPTQRRSAVISAAREARNNTPTSPRQPPTTTTAATINRLAQPSASRKGAKTPPPGERQPTGLVRPGTTRSASTLSGRSSTARQPPSAGTKLSKVGSIREDSELHPRSRAESKEGVRSGLAPPGFTSSRLKAPGTRSGIPAGTRSTKRAGQKVGSGLKPPGTWSAASLKAKTDSADKLTSPRSSSGRSSKEEDKTAQPEDLTL